MEHKKIFHQRVRRSATLIFLIAFGCLLGLGWYGAGSILPYFQAMLRGPQQISNFDLNNITSLSNPQFFIEVDGIEMYDTGFEYREKNFGITTSRAHYGAIDTGVYLLIVENRRPINMDVTNYVGTLRPVSDSIQREIIDEIEGEDPSLAGIFLPVMLSARDAYSFWRYFWGIVWLVALLGCMVGMLQALQYFSNPDTHWSMKYIEKRGDPDEVMASISEELSANNVEDLIGAKFTQNWLVSPNFFGIQAIRYADLVWFHKQITNHRVNGIPTGKTISLQLYDRYGDILILNGKDNKLDSAMHLIYQCAPHAIAGYDARVSRLWQKDKEQLFAAVDQRKQQLADRIREQEEK